MTRRSTSSFLHAFRHPGRGWAVAAVLWLVMVLAVIGHQWQFWQQERIDMDVLALLPHDEQAPEVDLAMRKLADAVSRQVVVMVGAPDWAQAREAGRVLTDALAQARVPLVAQDTAQDATLTAALEFYRPWRDRLLTAQQQQQLAAASPDALTQQALRTLYQPAVQGRMSEWVADPLGLWTQWWAQRAAASHARPRDGMLWLAADGMEWAVLTFTIDGSAFSLTGDAVYGDALQRATDAVQAQFPTARVLRAGVPLHAEAAAVQANREINTIGWGSLAGVLLLTWLAFRSVRPILLVGLSLVTGCAVALSVTAWCFGQVHLLTLVFGASLVGVAEDYGIHYFAARQNLPHAQPRSLMRQLLPALWLALVTSVIAYLALGAAPFPGLRQMAVFSATGLTAAMLTVVCWFPFLDRGTVPHSRLADWLGNTLLCWPRLNTHMARDVRRGTAAGAFLLLTLGIWGVWQLKAQDDVRQLQGSPAALIEQQKQIGALLGMPSPAQFYLVQGPTEEDVLQREEALKARLDAIVARGVMTGYSAVSDWVPSVAMQARHAELTRKVDTEVLAAVNMSLGEHLQRPAFAPVPLTLSAWLAQSVSAAVRPLWLGRVSDQFASVVMLRGLNDVAWLPQLAQQAEGLAGVRWVDKPAEISTLLARYRGSMTGLLVLGHVLVLVALTVRFGRAAWRAWLPTALATVGAAAVLGWMGQPWQLFNVLALVLLLGVGVDYGIFLLEHEDDPSAWLAVVIGAGSTWLSFGLLGLSSTPALRAFGLTLMAGLPLVLVLAPLFRARHAMAVQYRHGENLAAQTRHAEQQTRSQTESHEGKA